MGCTVIFAMDKNGIIGNGIELPWKGDDSTKWDMKHFKEETTGNIVIMGYNTAKGMKPLKNRINIVSAKYSPSYDLHAPINFFHINESIDASDTQFYINYDDPDVLVNSLNKLWPDKKVYCIGGAKLIKKFLSLDIIDEIIVTEFNKAYEGDISFDKSLLKDWEGQYELVPTDVNGTICRYTKKDK